MLTKLHLKSKDNNNNYYYPETSIFAYHYVSVNIIIYTRFVTFIGKRTSTEYLVVYGLVRRNLFFQLSSNHLLTPCGKQKYMVSKKKKFHLNNTKKIYFFS